MHVYHTTQYSKHHRAWSDGRVYTHILIAEKKLGRELKEGEVVHHIDGNKLNNDPDNLMVFISDADHKSFHAGADAYQNDDGAWYCKREPYACKFCGRKFILASGRKKREHMYCSKECFYADRTIIKDSIQELIDELKKANGNFSEVGRKYGVSPNAIIKRMKMNGYPYHSCDYKKSPARK